MRILTANFQKTVLLLFLTVILSSMHGINAGAAEWHSLGRGVLDNTTSFDVFIDNETIRRNGNEAQFWQAHVFIADQPLPSGKTYRRILIRRAVNCDQKTEANIEAIFYDSDGSTVDNYASFKKDNDLNPVLSGTISEAVLKFICNNGDGAKDEN